MKKKAVQLLGFVSLGVASCSYPHEKREFPLLIPGKVTSVSHDSIFIDTGRVRKGPDAVIVGDGVIQKELLLKKGDYFHFAYDSATKKVDTILPIHINNH